MANAAVYYGFQIGKETTPGTGVTAAKQITGMTIAPAAATETKPFRPGGNKYNTTGGVNKAWGIASLSGQLNLAEVVYPLCGLIKNAAPTGAGPYTWVFTSNPNSVDSIAQYTVQAGSTGFPVFKMAGATFSDWVLSADNGGANFTAKMFGQKPAAAELWTPSGTMDTVSATLPIVGVYRPHQTLKISTTYAGLTGATTTPFASFKFGIEGKIKPAWMSNGTSDYIGTVEDVPKIAPGMTLELSNTNAAYYANARNGDVLFMRYAAVVGTASITIDCAGYISGTPEPKSQDGVMAMDLSFEGIADSNMNYAPYKITVVNGVAAL